MINHWHVLCLILQKKKITLNTFILPNQVFTLAKIIITLSVITFSQLCYSQDCTVNAGAPQTVCQDPHSDLILNGLANDPNGPILSTQWTLITGPNTPTIVTPDSLDTSITGLISGNYTFRLTGQCSEGDFVANDVAITVVDYAAIPNLPDTLVVCLSDTIKFDGEPGITYSWVEINDPWQWSFSPTTGDSTVIGITNIGIRGGAITDAILEADNGVCTVRDTFTVKFIGQDTLVHAGGDVYVCDDIWIKRAHDLYWTDDHFAFPGYSANMTWSQLDGPSTAGIRIVSNNESVVFEDLVPGTYEFELSVESLDSCVVSGKDTVLINVSAEDLSGQFDNDYYETICTGENSIFINSALTLKPGETLSWSSTDCPHLTLPDTNTVAQLITGFNPCDRCNIVAKLDNGYCQEISNYRVDVIDVFVTDKHYVRNCGQTFGQNSYIIGGCNTGYYLNRTTEWTVISSPDFPTGEKSHNIINLSEGIHIWQGELTIGGCFADSFTETVEISTQGPVANAGTDPAIPCGDNIATLTGNDPGPNNEGVWYQLSGPNTATISDINDFEPTVSGLVYGDYVFQWIINGNETCVSSADEVVVSLPAPTIGPVNAGADFTTCYNGAITLSGSIPPDGTQGSWTVNPTGPTFSNTNDPFAIVTGTLPNTVYTFTWTITSACDSNFDEVEVTTDNIEGPPKADAGADQCFSNAISTFALSANAVSPATGEWVWINKPGATASISNINDPNATVTNAVVDGDYILEWVSSVTNCSDSRDTVIVSLVTTTPYPGLDNTICGTTGNLAAANTSGGYWSEVYGPAGGVIIADSTSSTSPVTFSLPGNYIFTWKSGLADCGATRQVSITASFPETPVAGNDTTLCFTNTTTLSANAVSGGHWQVVSRPIEGNDPTISDIYDPNATISNMDIGDYILEWISPSVEPEIDCLLSDQLNISIIPRAEAGAPNTVCQVNNYLLEGNEPSDAATSSWSFISGPSTPTITRLNSTQAVASDLVAGDYVFQYDISAPGCSTSDLFNLTIDSLHHADGGDDMTICSAAVDLNGVAPPAGSTSNWSIVAGGGGSFGAPTSNPINSYAPLLENTVYHFVYTVTNGTCISEEDIYVVTCPIYLPVELSYFESISDGCEVDISWRAESETQFHHYEVERSTNGGLTFESIEKFEARGNNEPAAYHWVDEEIGPGTSFYRLKMVDLDGSFSYSEIKMVIVDCGAIDLDKFIIFPNPVSADHDNEIIAKVRLNGSYKISIVNLFAHELAAMPLENIDGWTTVSFPIDDFPAGTYLISIFNENGQVSSKPFVIQD